MIVPIFLPSGGGGDGGPLYRWSTDDPIKKFVNVMIKFPIFILTVIVAFIGVLGGFLFALVMPFMDTAPWSWMAWGMFERIILFPSGLLVAGASFAAAGEIFHQLFEKDIW